MNEPLLAIKMESDATLCASDSVALLPQDMTGVACMLLLIWLVQASSMNEILEELFIAPFVYIRATSAAF